MKKKAAEDLQLKRALRILIFNWEAKKLAKRMLKSKRKGFLDLGPLVSSAGVAIGAIQLLLDDKRAARTLANQLLRASRDEPKGHIAILIGPNSPDIRKALEGKKKGVIYLSL